MKSTDSESYYKSSGGLKGWGAQPLVLREVQMPLDVQQDLLEEAQPLLLKLLALLKHLFHVLHVLWRTLIQLIQGLLVLLFGLQEAKRVLTSCQAMSRGPA